MGEEVAHELDAVLAGEGFCLADIEVDSGEATLLGEPDRLGQGQGVDSDGAGVKVFEHGSLSF